MFDEEKESLWKKKGFYLSVCTALICVLALGTVYYKMNYQKDNGKNLFADSATAAPAPSKPDNVTGGSAINGSTSKPTENDSKEASVNMSQSSIAGKTSVSEGAKKGDTAKGNTKTGKISKKPVANTTAKPKETPGTASSNKAKEDKDKNNAKGSNKKAGSKGSVATMSETGIKDKFDIEKGMLWPVSGDVILKYSMSNTVYFKTLAQYKCNPAIVISSEEGTKVKAAADGTVTKVSESDEIGNTITVDIGSGYTVTYGQLKDVAVKEGQAVKEGDVIAKIAKPTKYYSQEGSNLYLQVMEKENSVDPLLLLR